MNNKYLALSLTEILFVLGGLIILGTIGLLGSRYALEKSREAHYKSNVKLLYASLVDFKNDFGRYPLIYIYERKDSPYSASFNCTSSNGCWQGPNDFFSNALGYRSPSTAILKPYFQGLFDGGYQASYYYYVQPHDGQFVIVCVSLGGIQDTYNYVESGFYCEGDGIGVISLTDTDDGIIPYKEIGPHEPYTDVIKNNMDRSNWDSKKGGFSSL